MQIELNRDERGTLTRAFDKWGDNAQIGMAMEELAETITALNHFQRGRVPIGRVIEEFADSIVCVGQVLVTKGDPRLAELERAVCGALDKLAAKLSKGDHNYVAARDEEDLGFYQSGCMGDDPTCDKHDYYGFPPCPDCSELGTESDET